MQSLVLPEAALPASAPAPADEILGRANGRFCERYPSNTNSEMSDNNDASQHGGSQHGGDLLRHAKSRRRSFVTADRKEKSGNHDVAAGHLRAKDIVHINTNAKWLKCMQRLITPDKVTLADAFIFILLYAGSICIFAGLLYAVSPDGGCYKLEEPGHFGYDTALWISMHSFSTIGFGSIAPRQRCTSAQIIVFVESFVALLVYGFISGCVDRTPLPCRLPTDLPSWPGGHREARLFRVAAALPRSLGPSPLACPCHQPTQEVGGSSLVPPLADIVKMFLRPTSRIRFSKNLLLNHGRRRVETEDDELDSVRGQGYYKYLTFRMVREGKVQMRSVNVRMQAQYWHAGKNHGGLVGREHHKGRVVSLNLEQDYFTAIEQLQVCGISITWHGSPYRGTDTLTRTFARQVWHRVDEHSPLWNMREHLGDHLDGVEVSVSAFDMASEQVRDPGARPACRTCACVRCVRARMPLPASQRALVRSHPAHCHRTARRTDHRD